MELTPSDRLKLKVDALSFRLKEVSAEVSAAKGEAYELQSRLESLSVSSLMEGKSAPGEEEQIRQSLRQSQSRAERSEAQEVHLKGLLRKARLDYLRELRRSRPRRWLIME